MAKKYAAIQMLRCVAATFVVIDLAVASLTRNWPGSSRLDHIAWSLGEVGVIVLFGISGFIMTTTQYESFGSVDNSLELTRFRGRVAVPRAGGTGVSAIL